MGLHITSWFFFRVTFSAEYFGSYTDRGLS